MNKTSKKQIVKLLNALIINTNIKLFVKTLTIFKYS
jgi:hypothetical protein